MNYKGFDLEKYLKKAEFRVKFKKKTFCLSFKKDILDMISLVVMINSDMKLLKVSNFFWGKAGVINASISKVCDSTLLKRRKKLFQGFVDFEW